MLPYFKYTEEIQTFCELMGYTIRADTARAKYVCVYSLDYSQRPIITSFDLDPSCSPYIPDEKVIDYLTLILNSYSYEDAIKEIGVVGNGHSSSS